MSPATIQVEVAYALTERQSLIVVEVATGSTLRDAIAQSGILDEYSEIDLKQNKTGIFGKTAPLDTVLEAGDRVEIYRPLIADPKERRRQRASVQN